MRFLYTQQAVLPHDEFGTPFAVKTVPQSPFCGYGVDMKNIKNPLMKTINFLLVLSLLISTVSMGVFAEETTTTPLAVTGVSLDESRLFLTVTFNKELTAATTSTLVSRLRFSYNGYTPSSNYLSSATISGNEMKVRFSSSISYKENYVYISPGTFVGQEAEIKTPTFDASSPALLTENSVVLDKNEKTITVKFDSRIKGYPNNDSLKNGSVFLYRNGSSTKEVIPEDDISIDTEKGTITISLSTWISGNYTRVSFAECRIQNADTGNINLSTITTPYIDASTASAVPEIDYVTISSDKSVITINFTERILNAYSASSASNALLKSKISISSGGTSNYQILSSTDTITLGSNYIRISLATPLTSSRNYVKIAADSLTDYSGNLISEDLITDNITNGMASTAGAPEFSYATLASNSRIVLYFTMPVQKSSSISASDLRSKVSISRNGGSFTSLSYYDSVSFSDTTMVITLNEPLSGSNNRVRVTPYTVSSSSGALLASTITTSYLTAGMAGEDDDYYGSANYPTYNYITYDASSQRVQIHFTDDIRLVSSQSLTKNILISRNGGSYTSLSSYDVVTISPSNVVTILLSTPLSGTKNSFRIQGGTLADYDTGYVTNQTITTDYVSASGSSSSGTSGGTESYSGNVSAAISDDLYSIVLTFSEPMYNNKDSLETLKGKIQISRNGSFRALSSDDYIRLDSGNSSLLIVLSEPADEYNSQIRISSGSLRTADGNSISNNITTLPLGESSGSVRAYINDVAVSGLVSSSESGTSSTITISDSSKLNSYSKKMELLIKAPSDSKKATLNISASVAKSLANYDSVIALSLGKSTHFIPLSNAASLSDGDTLSIIVDSSSSASTKLSSASSKNSFTIEAPATSFSVKKTTAAGSQTDITHTAFATKRFMLEAPSQNKTAFTLVRIESSGDVIPVPTSSEVVGGVIYLDGKTLKDGDYAAISASHSFTVTDSWVSGPANTLGSRLILTNTTGSSINTSEAITRSETVTIMAKTLGVYGDMKGASPFFDMLSTDSYFNAVMSTVSYKLISGYPDGTFKPGNKLTRAEAMTIVARAIRFMKGKSVSASSDMTLQEATNVLSRFTDAKSVDDWAKVDIAECVNAGVVNGDNNGRLNPKSYVTRAELIQLMYNILTKADL